MKVSFKQTEFDKETGRAVWIVSGGRLSFPHLWKPGPDPETGAPSTRKVDDPIGAGAESILYAGCYVKVKLQVNCDVSASKTKVWVNLAAIQFLEDGERFGGAGMSDEELADGFDEVEGDFEKPESDDFDDDDIDEEDMDLDDDDDDLDL